MDSTQTIFTRLAERGERKKDTTPEFKNEIIEAPQLMLKPGTNLGNELANILGQSMAKQSSPMD